MSTLLQPAMTLRLSAVASNVLVARQALEGAARYFGADDALTADIKLAISEACTNVVKHAYADSPTGEMVISVTLHEGNLVVIARDFGKWETRVPDPHEAAGVGLQLMLSLANVCTISRSPDHTEVCIEFSLNGAGEPR